MTGKEAIRSMLEKSRTITQMLLGDLSDSDLLVRPLPGANHIAWQLGHLASSEHRIIGTIAPKAMPALPEGFEAKHAKETANSDSPANFYTKAEYMKVLDEQRKGTLAYLDSLSDEDLSKPLDLFNGFIKSYGDLVMMPASHEMMHVGQYSSVRRKLGKAHAF
jgi:hypothetical protein